MKRITLLTESRYHQPAEIDWYIQQVLDEDGLVQQALETRGYKVDRLAWNAPGVDWSARDAIVFRTTWDYFHHFKAFKQWLDALPADLTVVNPIELIRWNFDKHYLKDLTAKGVPVVESSFRCPAKAGDANTDSTLRSWCEAQGGDEWVLKPTISGAGRHTYRFSLADVDALEVPYRELIAEECMVLQPFQYNVLKEGEVSLMVIDGEFTHAVRKVAKPGDFRVQDDFGGTVHDHKATAEEIALAEKAIAACDPQPLYARVDILTSNEGEKVISELELIEPEMWFRKHPGAAQLLADAIAKRV
jgi:glutathione synthase/RimK-type ligase-like ATP-grasp enzyme